MKLQPGDKLQIVLTVGGVPYAKTWRFKHEYALSPDYALYAEDLEGLCLLSRKMTKELVRDIHFFGDEHEKDEQV